MSERIEIVPATYADCEPFFSGPPPHRLKAYVGRLGETVLGLGGLYFMPDQSRVGFLILSEAGRKHPKTLVKATREWLDRLASEGVVSVLAVADPAVPAAERFLRHFGFRPTDTHAEHTVYRWHAPTQ